MVLISPEAIIMLFLMSLFFLILIVLKLTYPKKFEIESDDTKNLIIKLQNLVISISIGIVLLIILIAVAAHVPINDASGDVSNWVALIVEMGIGIVIGVSIYLYSGIQQKKVKTLVEQINSMVKPESKLFKDNRDSVCGKIVNVFHGILLHVNKILEKGKKWEEETNLAVKNDLEEQISKDYGYIERNVKYHLEEKRIISTDFLTIPEAESVRTTLVMCIFRKPIFDKQNNKCDLDNFDFLNKQLPPIMNYYRHSKVLS